MGHQFHRLLVEAQPDHAYTAMNRNHPVQTMAPSLAHVF
jgi:hypothetical protein